jgi:pyrroloquinoline-quinone synthase
MKQLIDEVLADVDHRGNPFFRALEDGSFSRDDFLETQYQFYFAVSFFSRPMAALAAKIPEAPMRVEILRNVWEEHGEGDRARMHGATFTTFLARLGQVDDAQALRELDRRRLWPEVRAFNTLLNGACVLDDYLVGTATLGIVERMFAEISGRIGRAVVARGFMSAEQLVHYDLHQIVDVRHAKDFFDVLEPAWQRGAAERDLIEQGLRMGAVAFDQLYARLYRVRGRRWLR